MSKLGALGDQLPHRIHPVGWAAADGAAPTRARANDNGASATAARTRSFIFSPPTGFRLITESPGGQAAAPAGSEGQTRSAAPGRRPAAPAPRAQAGTRRAARAPTSESAVVQPGCP